MHLPPTTAPYQQARALAWVGAGILGAVALIALLAGCSHWHSGKPSMKPSPGPTGAEAQACRARCDLQKTQCEQRQQTREQGCAEHYASDKSDYNLCVKSGAPNCRAPFTCLGADLGICRQQYTPCITACARPSDRRLGSGAAMPAATEAPPPQVDKTPAAPPKVEKAPAPTPKANKTGGG